MCSSDLTLRLSDNGFRRWLKANVASHKQPGYAIVTLSLKPEGGVPGDMTADQMDAVAELADRLSFGEIRVTHTQNLVLPHVRRADLPAPTLDRPAEFSVFGGWHLLFTLRLPQVDLHRQPRLASG